MEADQLYDEEKVNHASSGPSSDDTGGSKPKASSNSTSSGSGKTTTTHNQESSKSNTSDCDNTSTAIVRVLPGHYFKSAYVKNQSFTIITPISQLPLRHNFPDIIKSGTSPVLCDEVPKVAQPNIKNNPTKTILDVPTTSSNSSILDTLGFSKVRLFWEKTFTVVDPAVEKMQRQKIKFKRLNKQQWVATREWYRQVFNWEEDVPPPPTPPTRMQ